MQWNFVLENLMNFWGGVFSHTTPECLIFNYEIFVHLASSRDEDENASVQIKFHENNFRSAAAEWRLNN